MSFARMSDWFKSNTPHFDGGLLLGATTQPAHPVADVFSSAKRNWMCAAFLKRRLSGSNPTALTRCGPVVQHVGPAPHKGHIRVRIPAGQPEGDAMNKRRRYKAKRKRAENRRLDESFRALVTYEPSYDGEVIRLSPAGFAAFKDALNKPPEPNERLRKLMAG